MTPPENITPFKPESRKVDFVGIWKKAGLLIWQNRFLLWFGVLMALGSPGGINYSFSEKDLGDKGKALQNYLSVHWELLIAIAAAAIILGIAFFLISLSGKAGLIRSVHLLVTGKRTSFRSGWREGKRYVLKLLKISVSLFLLFMLLSFILAIPVIYLLAAKSWISALFVGILAIAIFIPLAFIVSSTVMFAEFYIVLSNLSVWSAIEAGYNLFLKNIVNVIIFSLLTLTVNIIAGIVMLPIVGTALLLLAPAGVLFYFLNKILFGAYAIVALLLFALVIFFFSSIFATLTTTAKILFFKEIAQIKTEEEVKQEEKILEEGAAPVGGKA